MLNSTHGRRSTMQWTEHGAGPPGWRWSRSWRVNEYDEEVDRYVHDKKETSMQKHEAGSHSAWKSSIFPHSTVWVHWHICVILSIWDNFHNSEKLTSKNKAIKLGRHFPRLSGGFVAINFRHIVKQKKCDKCRFLIKNCCPQYGDILLYIEYGFRLDLWMIGYGEWGVCEAERWWGFL